MSLRIEISDRCTGHGRCYTLSAGLFEPDDDGFGLVQRAEVDSADDRAAAELAAESCPETAISLVERN